MSPTPASRSSACGMSPRVNEIHARFCSAHAAPRSRPDDRNDASASDTKRSACTRSPRKRCDTPSPRSTSAPPASSPSSRHFSSASPNVSSATSYAPTAISASPSSVSASACGPDLAGRRRLGEHEQQVVARGVELALLHARPCRARAARASGRGSGSAASRPSARSWWRRRPPRLDRLGALGGARSASTACSRTSAGTPGTAPSSATSSAAVARWWATGSIAARRAPRGPARARVAARPLGLRERAVRDLADELRLEVEVVVVELDEVALGEPFEQLGGRRCGRRARATARDRTVGADDRAVLEQRALGGSSASSRAATSPCSVAGTSRSASASPDSCTNATSSSTKNGLPPLRSSRNVDESRRRRRRRAARARARRSPLVERLEVEREPLYLPGAGVQRVSRPGRAVATSTNGRLRSRASSRSHSSSTSSVAQCRSESTSTSGTFARERLEERERRAQRVVAGAARVDAGPG